MAGDGGLYVKALRSASSSQDKYLILDVYDKNEEYMGELRQNELAEIFFSSGIYRTLGEFM